MNILCETTGEFQVVDFDQNAIVRSYRPSVVKNSHFISARAAVGQIKVLGNVSDEATDVEFEKYWEECQDYQLAVTSFLDAYSPHTGVKKTATELLKEAGGDLKKLDVPVLKALADEQGIELGDATKKADVIKIIAAALTEE